MRADSRAKLGRVRKKFNVNFIVKIGAFLYN